MKQIIYTIFLFTIFITKSIGIVDATLPVITPNGESNITLAQSTANIEVKPNQIKTLTLTTAQSHFIRKREAYNDKYYFEAVYTPPKSNSYI